MILGVGIDICEIKRISKVLEKFNTRFENRCFTERERIKCRKAYDMSSCYAKRFAAKEATSKALGTGISNGIFWREIEVINLPSGKPIVNLYGKAKKRLESMLPKNMATNILISITDEREYAQAFVIIQTYRV